nr:GGDEF domain-containing protein [Pseudoalteromonas sp. Of7M-16]
MLLSAGRFVRKLEYAAHHDELTDLLNRRGLSRYLDNIMPLSQRKCHSLSVIMIDVDHFKKINDHFGHQTGDIILTHIGNKLKSTMRASDLVVRWGGEEFCIVLFDTTPAHTLQLSEKIRGNFEKSIEQIKPEIGEVTLSAGIAYTDSVSQQAFEATQIHADKALYQAKNNGRNRSEVYHIEDS